MEKGDEERKTKLAYAHKIKDAFNAALYPAEKRDKEPVLGMEILFRHANRAKGMGRGVLLPLEVNEDDIKLRVRVYLVYKNSVVTKTDFLRDSVGGSKSRKDFKVKPRRDTEVWVSWSQLIPKPVEELKDDSQIDEWLASVTDASVREVEVQVNEQKWTHSPFTKTALDLDLHQLLAKNITVKVSSYNKRKSIVADDEEGEDEEQGEEEEEEEQDEEYEYEEEENVDSEEGEKGDEEPAKSPLLKARNETKKEEEKTKRTRIESLLPSTRQSLVSICSPTKVPMAVQVQSLLDAKQALDDDTVNDFADFLIGRVVHCAGGDNELAMAVRRLSNTLLLLSNIQTAQMDKELKSKIIKGYNDSLIRIVRDAKTRFSV